MPNNVISNKGFSSLNTYLRWSFCDGRCTSSQLLTRWIPFTGTFLWRTNWCPVQKQQPPREHLNLNSNMPNRNLTLSIAPFNGYSRGGIFPSDSVEHLFCVYLTIQLQFHQLDSHACNAFVMYFKLEHLFIHTYHISCIYASVYEDVL